MDYIKDRTGETNYTQYGDLMTIIKYINTKNVIVRFDNGYEVKTTYACFKLGNVLNIFYKKVCGVGYLGAVKSKNSDDNKIYGIWAGMLNRCYNNLPKYSAYNDCTVDNEWHSYAAYKKWYKDNFYKIEDEVMCVDKDILYKGNRIYSPKTCIFIPATLNTLLEKSLKIRGKYPIGVSKKRNKYNAHCKVITHRKFLGTFDTPLLAFNAYKAEKERHIKEITESYKGKIPIEAYNALMNWQIEITD